MREIKFRIWDKATSMWVDEEDISSVLLVYMSGLDRHSFIVEQFTGLHDSRGNEIWEGDLVRHSEGIGDIRWSQEQMGWAIGEHCIRYILFSDWRKVRVIGNVHQNLDLLQREEQ